MSLSTYKITDSDIAAKGVVAAPDKLTGTAAQNKAVFDRLIREVLKADFNNLIDLLAGTGGAGEIGITSISGVTGANVQAALTSLKALDDQKAVGSVVTAALALKESIADADLLIKTVSFNDSTGVFTFTRQNGTSFTIDTLLEKIAVNFSFNQETQKLELTLKDGTVQYVDLSSLIHESDYQDSDQIDFSVSNHVVTATIKAGSITDSMLSSSLLTMMEGYVATCTEKAAAAASSATTASNKESAANYDANVAAVAKLQAQQAATNAGNSATSASGSATTASNKADAAAASALKAEGYAVEQQDGEDVGSGSPYYHKSAKHFSERAAADSETATGAAGTATVKATEAGSSASSASVSAATAVNKAAEAAADALKAEGHSVGKQNGEDVGSSSPYFQNNAEYFAEKAAEDSAAAASDRAAAEAAAAIAQSISSGENLIYDHEASKQYTWALKVTSDGYPAIVFTEV